jgi:TRAP-type mannitol/chloroaromatic compound transport system permease small subunit
MPAGKPLDIVESISVLSGQAVAWLTFFMVLVTFVIVVLRYVFGLGFIWLQESLTWMHAAVFMLGAAYTLQQDEHVRVDVFYRGMSEHRRAWVDLVGTVIFIFPFCGLLFFESLDYVLDSWNTREVSRNAGGLPYPAVPVLKSLLLLMPLAVALQGVSIVARNLAKLKAA